MSEIMQARPHPQHAASHLEDSLADHEQHKLINAPGEEFLVHRGARLPVGGLSLSTSLAASRRPQTKSPLASAALLEGHRTRLHYRPPAV